MTQGNPAYDLIASTQIEAFVAQGDGRTGAGRPTPSTMITVTPSTGLVDGQTVTVEGSYWNAPDGGTVSFAECKLPSTDLLNECASLASAPGTISFETPPPSKNACKKGGWQHYTDDQGTPFKNQGDCVSFVATHGKNQAGGGS